MFIDKKPESILIRSTNWIGDAVMTIPAVRDIRNNFPKSRITMLALPWVADVFRHSPWVDDIFIYDKGGKHKGFSGKYRLIRNLKEKRFSATILLQNAFEAALITKLARIPVRGGYNTDGRGLLLTHPVKKRAAIKDKHQVFYYQEMIAGLGLVTAGNQLELYLDPAAQKQVDKEWGKFKDDNNLPANTYLIGFNPGAAYGPAKRWPPEKFGLLGREINRNINAVMIILGTKADNNAAKIIKENIGLKNRIIDLTGKTDLSTAMAWIEKCSVLVTNDSGLMHVGAALQTPIAAIFGSTDHIATGPWTDKKEIIRIPMDCSPCMQTHCPHKHFHCMEGISPEKVFTAIKDLLLRMNPDKL